MQLNSTCMSDEETDTEDEGFVVHKPEWRSKLVNRLVTKLDERYNSTRAKKSTSKPRSARRLGSLSQRQPPKNVPHWSLAKKSSQTSVSSSAPADTPPLTPSSAHNHSETPASTSSTPAPPACTSPSTPAPHAESNLTPVSVLHMPAPSATLPWTPNPAQPPEITASTPHRSGAAPRPQVQLQYDESEDDDTDDPEFDRMVMEATGRSSTC